MVQRSAGLNNETPRLKTKPMKTKPHSSVIQAADLIARGECRTVASAAEMLRINRIWLEKQFKRDSVKAYLVRSAQHKLAAAVGRAAAVKVELLDCDSAKVRNEVASEILALHGIAAAKAGGQSLNVSVTAGYVIKLDGSQPEPPTIEATAVPVIEDDAERLIRDLG